MITTYQVPVVNHPFTERLPYLHEGDSDAAVIELKKLLNANGANLPVDSYFDPATTIAVIRFQRQYGLIPNGVVNHLTWAELTEPLLCLI
jgi:peptidoglycan hydrolase-like protein with peptidoglycan-binding domain